MGVHLNFIPGSYQPGSTSDLSPEEKAFFEMRNVWLENEGAYSHLHRTYPHALSVGLHDSPAGLATWILEKFVHWSDCDGKLDRLPLDHIMAGLTLYWVSGSLATSLEFYRDSRRHPFYLKPGERIAVPCAVAHFPHELPLPPRSYVERGYHVVRWTKMPRGGHFAAMEQPDLLARDIRAFYSQICEN